MRPLRVRCRFCDLDLPRVWKTAKGKLRFGADSIRLHVALVHPDRWSEIKAGLGLPEEYPMNEKRDGEGGDG